MSKKVGWREEVGTFITSLAGRQFGTHGPENNEMTSIILAKEI